MIRVLYVDDESDLLEIGRIYLEESGDFSVATIESATAALALMKNERFDAVISDYQMPGMDGIELLKRVRRESGDIPFIIFTGRGREEIVIEALNSGADFYMQKGGDPTSQFAELRHKVLSAVGRQQAEKKARETTKELTTISDQLIHTMDALAVNEDLYRTLFHVMINGFAVHEIICDENGIPCNYRFLEVNPAFERMTGLCREEIIGKTVLDILPDTEPAWIGRYGKVALTGSTEHFEDYSKEMDKYFEVTVYQNARAQFTSIMADVTERKRAEEETAFKNVILSTQQETSQDGILIVNETGKILSYNQRFIEIWNIPEEVIESRSDERALQSVSEKLADPGAFLARVLYLYVHNKETSYEEILLSDGRVLERFSAPMFGKEGKYYGRVWYFRDITERILAEQLLRESEERVRKKLNALLLPTGDIATLALAEIIDTEAIQSLMNDFYALTQIGIAIIDLRGNVLVATGWQDICTKFHRVHPGACKNCIESDTVLSAKTAPGTFRTYKCKNQLWDVVTPVMAGNNHIGNLFFGQFLFEDEPVDYELFRSQALHYGFDEKEYLAALDRVPRWSKGKVDTAMNFYTRFAGMISKLSHGNIERARMMTERDLCLSSLRGSEEKFRSVTENAFDMIALLDLPGNFLECNQSCVSVLGYSHDELISKNLFTLMHPDDRENTATLVQEWMQDKGVNLAVSARIAGKDGSYRSADLRITLLTDEDETREKILVTGKEKKP